MLSPSNSQLYVNLCTFLAGLAVWLLTGSAVSLAQEVKIWEFSPYEVEIWYAFDASVNASEFAQQEFANQLRAEVERTFRAAWNVRVAPLAPELSSAALRNFEDFSLDDMTASELVLVVSLTDERTKAVRTFDAALESLSEVYLTTASKVQLESSAARLDLPADSPARRLISKCVVDAGGLSSIQDKLKSAQITSALILRSELPQFVADARPLITLLPWQTDTLFRQRDKLFLMLVGMQGEQYTCQVREVDCPMRYVGNLFADATENWSFAPRLATATLTKAFAPVARVEDAEARSAVLRLRAGGLIVNDDNPSAIKIGDVLHPIVRRDDRNGIPTLLEPLSWTFAAVTATDGVKLNANVYTYSGGPGLQGRQNRRTERVLLRVRPRYDETDIQVVTRGSGRPQAGCFVYRRDLLTEEFEFLGRTDWRGRFTIPVPDEYEKLLPEEIRYQRFLALKEAQAKAVAAEKAIASAAQNSGETEGQAADANLQSGQTVSDITADPLDESQAVALRSALTQIYIKSGDTVLAKLPMVPGLKTIEIAGLPDNSRRLNAEAFVRGFQGEILDLIGLRSLLAARVKLHLMNDRLDEAETVLDELRRLKNYNEMVDKLEFIQRKILDEKEGTIPIGARNTIDRMFQTTRTMLQKYFHDNLLTESEQAVKAAHK